jgi:subtilisin family serine protease
MNFSRGISRLFLTSVALSLCAYSQGQSGHKFKSSDKYVPGQLIVRYKDAVAAPRVGAAAMRASATSAAGPTVSHEFRKIRNLRVVQLPDGASVRQALDQLRADPSVLYAEPDYIVHSDEVVPNDPMFSQMWAMKNTGQNGGTVDADINATDAWTITTGSNSVIVGTIDTGVDYTQPDLAANMFTNPSDCTQNGIDDDGNGYVDDCHGWNGAYSDGYMYDDVGHGTHVAGTIGASGNNALGVVGVNWQVTIMPCKFLVPDGYGGAVGSTSAAINCLDYFATMKDLGYNIIATNNSWGGGGYSQALYDAIKENMDRGILFIAAAGNGGADGVGDNNDQFPNYPSNYDLPNIIAVAATTRTDAKSSFSNYGRRTVDLGAPGSEILSTVPAWLSPSGYAVFSGTSMATPHVTGTVALLKAYDPSLTWYEVRNLILAGGDVKSSMANTFTGKRLNANGSLTCANRPVSGRLTPDSSSITVGLGDTVLLSYLNINCKDPAGAVSVTASPGGTLQLHDDGLGGDLVAGDGAYSAEFNVYGSATTVTFPGDDAVNIKTLRQYNFATTAFSYRNIAGTNLQLSDELAKPVTTPFVIKFGGASYSTIYVGSNGLISFDTAFNSPANSSIPLGSGGAFIAPWWQDLQPYPNTNQNVFTATIGSSPNREFVVEWRDVPMWDYPTQFTVKFQVVFFENSSNVLINYADTNFADGYPQNQGGYATVGVQVAGKSAVQYSFLQQAVADGSALLWTAEPDGFEVQLAQPLVKAYAGQASHFDVTVRSVAGFNSDVTITCGGLQPPSICTPVTVHPTHEGVSASIAVSDPTVGDKGFELIGTAAVNGSQHQVEATLRVSDLAIDPASPATVTVPHGASSQDISVVLHATGTFDSAVNISCAGLPAGATCRFNPSATVYPTTGTPLDVHVNVDTAFSTPLATSSFQINALPVGMTSPRSDSVDLTTTINTDFSLTPSTTSFTGGMGPGYKGTVLVEAHDGYIGTVTLSCSVVPAGPSCSLDTPVTSTFPLTANVTVGLNGLQADDYQIVITGNDGSHSHIATTVWHVSGFQVSLPAAISIYAQGNNYLSIPVTRINGYAGQLYFHCGNGPVSCYGFYYSGSSVQLYFSSLDAVDPVPVTLIVTEYSPGTATVQLGTTATVKGYTISYGALTSQTVFPGETPQGYQVTLTPYNGYDLTTQVHCYGYLGRGACSASPASAWVPSGNPYTLTLNATAPLDQNYDGGDFYLYGDLSSNTTGAYIDRSTSSFSLHVKDFSFDVNPYYNYVLRGTSLNAGIQPYVTPGWSTSMALACPSQLPQGVTCSITPGYVSPPDKASITLGASTDAALGWQLIQPTASAQLGANAATRSNQFYLIVQDLTVNVSALSATTITAGGSADYIVGVGGVAGSITFGCAGLPAGVSCSANPASVSGGGQSTVTVSTTPGVTPPGTSTITFVVAEAGVQKSTTASLTIKDFAVSSANLNPTANVGSSATVAMVTKAFAGFSSTVALACAGLPPGATCSFSNNNFVPSATGTSTTVTIATTTAVPGGVYPFTITATSQGQTRTLNATLTVKDFHFASTPTSRSVGTVPSGQTDHTTYALSAFADNGFSSSVALSCVTPLPTGVTCAFSPSSVTPSGAGVASTLTVTVASTTLAGSYTLSVKGVAGSIIRQLPLTLNTGGPNFTQAVTPVSVNTVRGSGGSFTVTYTSLGGMSDPIAVGCSAPAAGMACSAVPATVTPGVTPNNQSVVTFTTSGATPTANTTVAIAGSALGIVRSNSATLSIKDFSLTSTAVGDLSINAGVSAMRSMLLKSLNGLTGTVALSCAIDGAPAGVTCTVPASATPSASGATVTATIATTSAAPAAGYVVTVSGTSGGQIRQYQFTTQIRDYTVTLQDSVLIGAVPAGQTDSANNVIFLQAANGFNSSVTLSCLGPLPTGVTCTFSPVTLVPTPHGQPSALLVKASSTTPSGSYPITVRSTAGTLVKNTIFTLNVGGPNFIPIVTPTTVASLLGTPATYSVTFLIAGGMNTAIDVTCPSTAPGITCTANPLQVLPGVTPGNQSIITVTGTPGVTPLSNVGVMIEGRSLDLARRKVFVATYTPRDFALSTTTPARSVNAASSVGTVVAAKALNGFSGVVTLGCSIDAAPTGMTCTLPASVSPSATGAGVTVTVATTAATPAGTYTVHVNGSNSGQIRSASFTVDVRDFSLDASPSTQTIAGTGTGSTTFAITLTALNGLASSVSLSCGTPIPTGLACSFSPSSMVPSGAGSASTLTVNVTASNTQGDHPLIIRAASGTLVRQQTVIVTHGP